MPASVDVMRSEERQAIRRLVDQAARAQLADDFRPSAFTCSGCGVGIDRCLSGCRVCVERRHGRMRRGSSKPIPHVEGSYLTDHAPWYAVPGRGRKRGHTGGFFPIPGT